MSGLARWVVREAQHQRSYRVGLASRSNLCFYAARIIDGTYALPFDGVY